MTRIDQRMFDIISEKNRLIEKCDTYSDCGEKRCGKRQSILSKLGKIVFREEGWFFLKKSTQVGHYGPYVQKPDFDFQEYETKKEGF